MSQLWPIVCCILSRFPLQRVCNKRLDLCHLGDCPTLPSFLPPLSVQSHMLVQNQALQLVTKAQQLVAKLASGGNAVTLAAAEVCTCAI